MVRIEIKDSNKCMGEKSLYITFDFSYQILDIIKALPSRIYIPENKQWEVPSILLDKFRKQLMDNNIDFRIFGLDQLNQVSKISYQYNFKTKPLSHQLELIDYGLRHNSFLIGDEMGLGKTKEALDLSCIRKTRNEVNKVLVVCGDNSLKFNWLNEIKKHTNESGWILGMRKRKNGKYTIGSTVDKITDLRALCGNNMYMITNIESFRNKDFLQAILDVKNKIDMVIFDEAHKCFDYNTKIITDKGLLKIGDIVKNNLEVKILSYNEKLKINEWKKIINRFENEVNTNLLELEIETSKGIKNIKCTANHKFYTTNRGWVKAIDLSCEDNILDTCLDIF